LGSRIANPCYQVNERALIRIFNKAFSSGIEMKTKIEPYGTTITKQIQVGEHALNVGFYY